MAVKGVIYNQGKTYLGLSGGIRGAWGGDQRAQGRFGGDDCVSHFASGLKSNSPNLIFIARSVQHLSPDVRELLESTRQATHCQHQEPLYNIRNNRVLNILFILYGQGMVA